MSLGEMEAPELQRVLRVVWVMRGEECFLSKLCTYIYVAYFEEFMYFQELVLFRVLWLALGRGAKCCHAPERTMLAGNSVRNQIIWQGRGVRLVDAKMT